MQENEQLELLDDDEYRAFVDKFKPKKTTDDCYTPPIVYDAVRDWACREYGFSPDCIVRPFYPGGDYERFHYPEGCVVLDNPPFSILSKICEFYLDRGIRFFLFAPSLTAFSGKSVVMRMNHIICDANITYENGAVVQTAFVTSFGGSIIAQTSPELGRMVTEAAEKYRKEGKQTVPKYEYPMEVLTAAMLQRYSKYGVDFKVRRGDCVHISKLDAQHAKGKAVFGGGLLLSERVTAERAAAERVAAERATAKKIAAHYWDLSQRERDIISTLGRDTA